jgi:hypothetical protein
MTASRPFPPWFALLIGFALSALAAPAARADALDGALEVQSAFVNQEAGVYQLHARVLYPVNDQLREALRDGVSLSFDLDVTIQRQRRYWVDADVVALTLRRELSYHTVSDRYLVRSARTGEQSSYPTLDAALEALGVVENWPILVASQVRGGEHTVSVRAGVRRGRLTDALRVLLFWTDDWHRESEWYSWSLPR